eukprot:TRINITY_DN16283_c0_g1_i1.p2 TRINITY_DN16283_c0_g1~~TRINITY_DN16283_c0_g1_i1.p2  ORF type:complete len:207 (+),score=-16.02 TRINITY_DN16283_c0_g1_i1:757-1377(+)
MYELIAKASSYVNNSLQARIIFISRSELIIRSPQLIHLPLQQCYTKIKYCNIYRIHVCTFFCCLIFVASMLYRNVIEVIFRSVLSYIALYNALDNLLLYSKYTAYHNIMFQFINNNEHNSGTSYFWWRKLPQSILKYSLCLQFSMICFYVANLKIFDQCNVSPKIVVQCFCERNKLMFSLVQSSSENIQLIVSRIFCQMGIILIDT